MQISPISFRSSNVSNSIKTNDLDSKKVDENQNNDKKSSSKIVKYAIAATAVAATAVAATAMAHIKLHNNHLNKLFKKNFIPNFEKQYGKIEKCETALFDDIVALLEIEIKGNKDKYKQSRAFLRRLNKEGLQNLYKNKELPEELLGKNDGVLIAIVDKADNPIYSKPIIFDKIDTKLQETFGDSTVVELK